MILNFDKKDQKVLKKEILYIIFLSSLRQRVNDPLGVRKKKREQGKLKLKIKFIQL